MGKTGAESADDRREPLVKLLARRIEPVQALARGLGLTGERGDVDRRQPPIAHDHPTADHHVGHGAAVAARAEPPGHGAYRPRLLLCRETYVAETSEVARAEGALALQGFWYLSSLASPPLPTRYSDERFKELTARIWGGRTYDELAAIGGMLIGSPEQIAAQVERLEAIGVDTLLLVCSFGNLSHAQVCRSLELFARAVIHARR